MKRWFHLSILTVCYCLLILVKRQDVLSFRFDPGLIERYSRSQDITHEVNNRIFLSDSEIYLATGYLYAGGSDPSQNNFEHPPAIKYLFGWSARMTGNPLLVQLAFGYALILLVYAFGSKMKNPIIGLLAAGFIMIDPLFIDILREPLLDLGQTVWMLAYIYTSLYAPSLWILQGIFLALFAGSKFWITPAFFIVALGAYRWYKKELSWRFFAHLAAALVFYGLLYIQSFILTGGRFNLAWHMLKTVKYRLVHNTSSYFGASLVMFTTGYWKSWWGEGVLMRIPTWTIFWPIGLAVTLKQSTDAIKSKTRDIMALYAGLPIAYLLFLGVQAPFPRYFLIILPFIYISMADYLLGRLRGN